MSTFSEPAIRSALAPGSAATPLRLPDEEESAHLASLFRLLGDPTRVRILYALLQAGELCVTELAAAVETNETKVSQAMRLMRAAGVVRNRRVGRNIFYRLDDDHIRMLLDVSRDHLAHTGATTGVAR
jgi:DNA-binding transcriptional ArsR family regulator